MRRLILFDIDGTLVWGGPAKDAFTEAMLEVYGTLGDVDNVSFSGKTDPQIARELLRGVGVPDEDIDGRLPQLFEGYTSRLERQLVDQPMTVLPGVRELLDALRDFTDVGVGLLTGNIARGAELKLGSAGLWGRFAVGSYGSDHEERDELPAIALERAKETWDVPFEPHQAIIVGDTPRDVTCGQRSGTRTLAVATGYFAADELARTGPDHVVEDLSETREVLRLLVA